MFDLRLLLLYILLKHGVWSKGSYEKESYLSILPSVSPIIHLSFHLFVYVFQEFVPQFFLELSIMLGVHIQLHVREPESFKNYPRQARMTKNDQKFPKNRLLNFSRKSSRQFCLELVQNGLFYGYFYHFVKTACLRKIWFTSHVKKKKKIPQPKRFQYSLVVNISLIH